jgi:hypothetical protein
MAGRVHTLPILKSGPVYPRQWNSASRARETKEEEEEKREEKETKKKGRKRSKEEEAGGRRYQDGKLVIIKGRCESAWPSLIDLSRLLAIICISISATNVRCTHKKRGGKPKSRSLN